MSVEALVEDEPLSEKSRTRSGDRDRGKDGKADMGADVSSEKDSNRESAADPDPEFAEKSLFEMMVDALVRRTFTLEEVVDMAYEFGVQHGEQLRSEEHIVKKETLASKRKASAIASRSKEEMSAAVKPIKPLAALDALVGLKRAKSEAQESYLSAPLKDYVGVEPLSLADNTIMFRSVVSILSRSVMLDDFPDAEAAAQAHDRALIRALGPKNCPPEALNNPLQTYAKDPIDCFSQYDKRFRQALFGSKWTGPKEIDFSCLVLQSPPVKKK